MNVMLKISLFICCLLSFKSVSAQDFDLLYDKLDNSLFNDKPDEILENIKILNSENNTLSKTKKAIVNYKIASYYEKKINDVDNAIVYYEKSLSYEPDYYVPHLAVGYLYLNKTNEERKKYNEVKDPKLKQQYLSIYKEELKKALPHL